MPAGVQAWSSWDSGSRSLEQCSRESRSRSDKRSYCVSIAECAKSGLRIMAGDSVHTDLKFGPFELSVSERVLRRDGEVLPLGSRALDILIYLSEHPGEVISKQELLDHVWSDVTVEEGSLRVHVAAIRKALGDGQFGNRYIANIKGRGYSFVGTVVPLAGSTESGNDYAALSILGCQTALFSGDFDIAREMVDRAVALNPNSLRAWQQRGWTYVMAGQPEEAIRSFARTIPLN